MDELVQSIDFSDGINLGQRKIGCLLFAEDIVLLSNTRHGMQEYLHKLRLFLQKTYMEVNPSMCSALQVARVHGTKGVAVVTKPMFSINGNSVPPLQVLEQLKYLGHNYNKNGMIALSTSNLEAMLELGRNLSS